MSFMMSAGCSVISTHARVAGSQAPESESILSKRLGYEPPADVAPVIVCASEAERAHLVLAQRKYRNTPELALSHLRRAREQLKVLGPGYTHLSKQQQEKFLQDLHHEMAAIETTMKEIQGIPRPIMTPQSKKWYDARNGALLQCVEAATLGMPLEVWKTRMGRFRNETTLQALRNVYANGGVGAFWAGTSAKMVESASKGAVLMFAKENIRDLCLGMQISPTVSGFLSGAGGGVCQTTVMGPCTFLVTAVVTGDRKTTLTQHISRTWTTKGIAGFYPGGVAIAFRQATNWASRQGFTDAVRELLKRVNYEDASVAKLSVREEVTAGIIGGTLACWNHPFEVARIEAQSRAAAGQTKAGMMEIFRYVHAEHGVAGLFKGVIPRIFLGIWQTTFMVTGANLIRTYVLNEAPKTGGGH